MGNFVVAAWEKGRQRRKDMRSVEADTAEHAIVRVVSSRPIDQQAGTYEAWPMDEPASNLRITYSRRTTRA